MAAVFVDACMGELAKLKQKVRARKIFLFNVQDDTQVGDDQLEPTKKQSPSSSSSSPPPLKSSTKAKDECILSETTICLLMDRFAPW